MKTTIITKQSSLSEITEKLNSLVGEKVTIFKNSEFGFPQLIHCKLFTVKLKPCAQYTETIEILFIPKGKRNVRGIRIYNYTDFLVYLNHIQLNDSAFIETIEGSDYILKKSDLAFSSNYFNRAIESTTEEPIIKVLK